MYINIYAKEKRRSREMTTKKGGAAEKGGGRKGVSKGGEGDKKEEGK